MSEVTVVEYDSKGNVEREYKTIHGETPCFKHRRYKGIRKPRVACEQCWRIFFAGERQYYESF